MKRILFLVLSLTFTTFLFAQIPPVPSLLKVPEGNKLSVHVYAKGLQIYQCARDITDTSKIKWVFVGPEAILYANARYKHIIGKHYAGPVWESSDGSIITGAKMQQTEAPDPDTIPWLLLSSSSNTGSGIFSKITFIQRLNTKGGKAPVMKANNENIGKQIRVPYTAEYFFYQAG